MYVDSRTKDQTQVIVPQLIRRKLYLQKRDYFIFTLFLAVPTSDPGFEHMFHYWILNLFGCCALPFSPAVTASQLCRLTFLQKVVPREIHLQVFKNISTALTHTGIWQPKITSYKNLS